MTLSHSSIAALFSMSVLSACSLAGITGTHSYGFGGGHAEPPSPTAAPPSEAAREAPKAAAPATGALPPELDQAFRDLGLMADNVEHGLERSTLGQAGVGFIADGLGCTQAWQRVDAQHHLGATPVTLHGFAGAKKVMPFRDVEPEICAHLETIALDWDRQVADAKNTAETTALAPYQRVGIAGDKLKFVGRMVANTYDLVGANAQLLTTPEAVRRASVFFVLHGDGVQTEWSLERFTFSGNAKVSVTEEGFLVRPGPSKYR